MSECKKEQWVYKSLIPNTGLMIKSRTREHIYDAKGTAIDTVWTPRVKVKFTNHILVIDEAMGKRFGYAPADLAKLVESRPSFERWFWCIASPEKVLTKQEAEDVEKKIVEQNAGEKAPKVIHGARGRK